MRSCAAGSSCCRAANPGTPPLRERGSSPISAWYGWPGRCSAIWGVRCRSNASSTGSGAGTVPTSTRSATRKPRCRRMLRTSIADRDHPRRPLHGCPRRGASVAATQRCRPASSRSRPWWPHDDADLVPGRLPAVVPARDRRHLDRSPRVASPDPLGRRSWRRCAVGRDARMRVTIMLRHVRRLAPVDNGFVTEQLRDRVGRLGAAQVTEFVECLRPPDQAVGGVGQFVAVTLLRHR